MTSSKKGINKQRIHENILIWTIIKLQPTLKCNSEQILNNRGLNKLEFKK
jgi:hypothetical protein